MATPGIIAITPGAGQFLDAVTLVVGANTVVRETMVIADPVSPTQLAGVTAAGALQVDGTGGTISATTVFNAVAPSPTTGTSLPLQSDYKGNLYVKDGRRSLTISQATTISGTTNPTTVLNAQAAGVFADITDLVVTVVPGATASVAFTGTLSDGTKSYVYSLVTGALSVVPAAPTDIDLGFDPALPATTAATPWTLTLSSASVTAYVTVVAIQEVA